MAGIPKNFDYASPVIGSYDWLDLTSGLGYRRYYACASNISGGTTYFLSTRVINAPSTAWYTQALLNVGAATKIIDLDFDITFKAPANVGGDAFINVTVSNLTQVNIDDIHVVIRVYHVSAAAVETELGNGTSTTPTWGAALGVYARNTLKIALSTKHFAIGEKLRLTVEGWGGDNTGGSLIISAKASPASLEIKSILKSMSKNVSFPHPLIWSSVTVVAASAIYPFPTSQVAFINSADFSSGIVLKYPQ